MATIETSLTKSATPHSVELIPSVRLRWWVGSALLGALISIAVLPLPITQRLAGAVIFLLVSIWRWRCVVSRYPRALKMTAESGWSVFLPGQWLNARRWRCTYLTSTLVIVDAEFEGLGRYRFPMLADQTDADSWRWLQRRLVQEEANTD